jgi:hypothetical protein
MINCRICVANGTSDRACSTENSSPGSGKTVTPGTVRTPEIVGSPGRIVRPHNPRVTVNSGLLGCVSSMKVIFKDAQKLPA